MTTTELRKQAFEFVVAPGSDGAASGKLYIDDGVSVEPAAGDATSLSMNFRAGSLNVAGTLGKEKVNLERVRFLGVGRSPSTVLVDGKKVVGAFKYDATTKVLDVPVGKVLAGGLSVQYS